MFTDTSECLSMAENVSYGEQTSSKKGENQSRAPAVAAPTEFEQTSQEPSH